jgi:hypothetical protein
LALPSISFYTFTITNLNLERFTERAFVCFRKEAFSIRVTYDSCMARLLWN